MNLERETRLGMKKTYILMLVLLLYLALIGCKKNTENDILPHIPSLTENETMKDVVESQAVDKEKSNFAETTLNDGLDEPIEGSESVMYYYIIGDIVRMREDASVEANTLGLLSLGSKVEYIDTKGEWIKVKYDNQIGYIREDLLSEIQPIEGTANETIEVADEVADNPTDTSYEEIEELDNPNVIVKKADRILQLWDGDVLKASYPIGLGWEPIGDKEREGDGKTPEGTYYVCTRNNYSRFYLSLGLSYPNKEDAYEGLESGLIDQSTYNQIVDAINREAQPPWNTALGGEIMIHGHGSQSDWTAGCIAVDDDIMDILWEHCRMGTKVIIEP